MMHKNVQFLPILSVSGKTFKILAGWQTYRTVSEDNCERESGIEPVKLLCDKSLQDADHTIYQRFRFRYTTKIKIDQELDS